MNKMTKIAIAFVVVMLLAALWVTQPSEKVCEESPRVCVEN